MRNGGSLRGSARQSLTGSGRAEVNAAAAKIRLVQTAEETLGVLARDPRATVTVSVEITAHFPAGVSDQVKRAVSQKVNDLGGFKNKTWE